MTTVIEPTEDRVVIRPADADSVSAGGIIIPDAAKQRPQRGEVLAVGPGRFEDGVRVALDVKPGDTVLYSQYGGMEARIDHQDVLVLSARDVLAVLRESP